MPSTPNIIGDFGHTLSHGDTTIVMLCTRTIDGRVILNGTMPEQHDVPGDVIEAERDELEKLGLGQAAMRVLA